MGLLIWIGFLAFFVAALVVGVRLLLLWSRTRQLPELLIGIGVLGIGPIGFGAMVAATAVAAARPGLGDGLLAVGSLAVALGIGCKCLFNWRVYHADSKAVGAGVGLVWLYLAVQFLWRALSHGFAPVSPLDTPSLAQSAVQVGALLWGSGEAIRYWLLMRRRSRIGLADPVVANRFLMWGIGAGAAGLGTGVGTAASVVTGVPSMEIGWVVASSSAHGFVAAVALSLAFLPPAPYLRRIRGDAASA